MTDPINSTTKAPGIVVFVAVLNFLTVAFFALLTAASLFALIFGNLAGVYDYVTRQMAQVPQFANYSLGLNFLFGFLLTISVLFGLFFLLIGIGLLKARRLAWYFQIALSIIGLFGFPVGTILNGVILALFFRPSVRDFFQA